MTIDSTSSSVTNDERKESSSPESLPSSPERILSGLEQSCWITKKEYTRVRLLLDMDPSDPTRIITERLQEYMEEITQIPPNTWFHRKSYRLVLSMLQIKNPNNGKYVFIRGINSEISVPTGSICAERAAIAAARSRFPNLRRRHFYAIAVMNFPLQNGSREPIADVSNPLDPCGACREYLQKLQDKNENFRVITYSDITCTEIHERFLFISQVTRETEPQGLSQFWKCLSCSTMNEPKCHECQHCYLRRFQLNSVQPLTKSILQILSGSSRKLSIKDINQDGKRKYPEQLLMQRLEASIESNLVESISVEDGEPLFELTPRGHEVVALLKAQDRKRLARPRLPRHHSQ